MHRRQRQRAFAAGVLAAVLPLAALVSGPAAQAANTADGYAANGDYCLGQCNDILPPGENGSATQTQIVGFKAFGTKPAHTDDQLGKYASLVDGYTGLTNQSLGSFFNDSSFGVPAADVESTMNPGGRSDVTITRDTTGIPHINGTTRSGTEYGAGYAAGQDRLWLMDVFRHLGRGELSGFAGGAPGNRQLEQEFYLNGAYSDQDVQDQLTRLQNSGPRGTQVLQDMNDYLAGLNQEIADARSHLNWPGEYNLTGNANIVTGAGIQPFQPADLLAIGTVISALFGSGGGGQVASALVKEAAEAKYGVAEGDQVWQAFREENDPEADVTLHDGSTFPYAQSPDNPTGVAMPDPGSVTAQQVVYNPTGSATSGPGVAATHAATTVKTAKTAKTATTAKTAKAAARPVAKGVLPANLFHPHGMSNALVVSGQYTDTGNPVAVFGPQTGYFAPQLLMLEEIQGPGIHARGAAFAGLNQYVELGRGQDYAWSATSAGQDITDTYAVTLCNTDGSTPTKDSSAYLFHGVCTPMDKLTRTDSWSPTIADSTPAGSYQLVAFRTKYGIVQSRATIGGKPVAYTTLRSTYGHEGDSMTGFQMLNDPDVVTGPAGFQQAAAQIGYTFNWFYVDAHHTAYYNSGLNPTRAANVDPNLPVAAAADGSTDWQNWGPATYTVAGTPAAQHPNSVDQDYYESWNNKIAAGYSVANFGDGSVYRSNLLNTRIKKLISSGTKITRAALAQQMEDAALTDLRGEAVLPELLQVVGTPTDPTQAAAVAELKTWLAHGAKRVEGSAGSKQYTDSDAIRIMDAWWPLLVKAEFAGGMGTDLYSALSNAIQVDQPPSGGQEGVSHAGSAFQFGWWSYVDKDLRAVLGRPVNGGLTQTFCGGGDLAQCRADLLGALSTAVATPATTVYPADGTCSAGDQWCADSIQQHPLGGITDAETNWQNRPTFQQVVQFPAHRGDTIADLALGRSTTASSYQSGFLQPTYGPDLAVDGDAGTRWASNWDDNEWLQVDLGASQQVGRVILSWETAYGKAYRIQTSTDGANWTTVWSTTAGQGGTDEAVFTPVTARYVRMLGVTRGTQWGYSVYEMGVYAQ